MPLPTKKSLPVFLYTKDVINIDVVPGTKSATYNVGELISFDTTAYETGTGGYYQGTEVTVVIGEKHDPTYTNAATLKFLGVMAEQYPPNFFLYKDNDGQLDLSNYTASPSTFAGSLERMTVCVMPNIILMDFVDPGASGAAAALVAADIGTDVVASQTAGADVGIAGKASLASDNDDGAATPVVLGKLIGIPVSGGNYGYVLFDPLGAR